jgi:hypothetical protein
MGAKRTFNAGIVSLLFIGLTVLGATPAWATNMWWQQALLLVHIPVGNQTFTTNYVFTASEGANTTVNVKCFNDLLQRIGPDAGVNVMVAAAQGQVANATPTTLQVVGAAGFTGIAWCWANNTASGLDFNVQTTVGLTTDLTPNGILNSPASTLVATSTGLAETSSNVGGIPFYTTAGGAQNFAVLINPTQTSRTLSLQLFNTAGIAQGSPLSRVLPARGLALLTIPDSFGLTTPPASGSVTITVPTPGQGYLGYLLTAYINTGRVVFTPIGLDGDNRAALGSGDAP